MTITVKLPAVKYPLYNTVLPSTGAPVKFRPYNVGEEKILLMANESGDATQIKLAMKQILTACVTGAPPIEEWASFDIESLYLQVRAKSESNTATFTLHLTDCPEKTQKFELCDVGNPALINLDEVKLTIRKDDGSEKVFTPGELKQKTQIKLADDLGVQLRYPTYEDLDIVKNVPDDSTDDDLGLEMIVRCTTAIFDANAVYPAKDLKPEELKDFFNQLSRPQLEKVDEFFRELPMLRYTAKVKCQKCGKDGEYTFEGAQSFFG